MKIYVQIFLMFSSESKCLPETISGRLTKRFLIFFYRWMKQNFKSRFGFSKRRSAMTKIFKKLETSDSKAFLIPKRTKHIYMDKNSITLKCIIYRYVCKSYVHLCMFLYECTCTYSVDKTWSYGV